MHVLGINGSMRQDRYTNLLVTNVISEMIKIRPDITTDMIQAGKLDISPCRVVCSSFCAAHPYKCSINDDISEVMDKIRKADAVIIGTPLYFRGPPVKFQALIERIIALFFSLEQEKKRDSEEGFRDKPCGLVGVAEYSNPMQVLEYLHDFANLVGFRTVRVSRLPYLGVGGQGDVTKDVIFNPFDRSKEMAENLLKQMMLTT